MEKDTIRPEVLSNDGTQDKGPPKKKRLRSLTKIPSPGWKNKKVAALRSGHLLAVRFSHSTKSDGAIWIIECQKCFNKIEMPLRSFDAKEKTQCDGCTVREKLNEFDTLQMILFEIYRNGRTGSEVILEAIDVVEHCEEVNAELGWFKQHDAARYNAALTCVLSRYENVGNEDL